MLFDRDEIIEQIKFRRPCSDRDIRLLNSIHEERDPYRKNLMYTVTKFDFDKPIDEHQIELEQVLNQLRNFSYTLKDEVEQLLIHAHIGQIRLLADNYFFEGKQDKHLEVLKFQCKKSMQTFSTIKPLEVKQYTDYKACIYNIKAVLYALFTSPKKLNEVQLKETKKISANLDVKKGCRHYFGM